VAISESNQYITASANELYCCIPPTVTDNPNETKCDSVRHLRFPVNSLYSKKRTIKSLKKQCVQLISEETVSF